MFLSIKSLVCLMKRRKRGIFFLTWGLYFVIFLCACMCVCVWFMHTNGPQIVPVHVFGSSHVTLADPLTLSIGAALTVKKHWQKKCLFLPHIGWYLRSQGKVWENLKAIFLSKPNVRTSLKSHQMWFKKNKTINSTTRKKMSFNTRRENQHLPLRSSLFLFL